MSHRILKMIMPLFVFSGMQAQDHLDTILDAVAKNNKSLLANRQYWEAKKLEYRTGIYLSDPVIQYQYLSGAPESAGNQNEWLAIQAFDFPTVYGHKRKLAREQSAWSDHMLTASRQDVLLEAKLSFLDLVYRNKLKAALSERRVKLEKLVQDFQRQLDQGEGNILDLNKVKLQLMETMQRIQENDAAHNRQLLHLTELNGGETLAIPDTVYPKEQAIPPFEELERAYELADPRLKGLEQELHVADRQLKLEKAMRLPRFEAGYRYQSILDQKFNGIHAAVRVPLWEHKNRVRHQRAKLDYQVQQLTAHRTEHYLEIREWYDEMSLLKENLELYRSVIPQLQHVQLLDKALKLGELSTSEYFLEISYQEQAFMQYLKTEHDYHATLAQLNQYKL
ncbi:MAG TPA: TolC family protein [Saprospiraceae bacterium]|nr:TolC family protein [Saprospiraceae bacterium]